MNKNVIFFLAACLQTLLIVASSSVLVTDSLASTVSAATPHHLDGTLPPADWELENFLPETQTDSFVLDPASSVIDSQSSLGQENFQPRIVDVHASCAASPIPFVPPSKPASSSPRRIRFVEFVAEYYAQRVKDLNSNIGLPSQSDKADSKKSKPKGARDYRS